MKKIKVAYVALFCIFIICFGTLSFRLLVNSFVNGERQDVDWNPQMGDRLETDIAANFLYKSFFLNFSGAMSSFLNQPSLNNVYKLENGHLIIPEERLDQEEIKKNADEVIQYANYCMEKGKPFLFVQPILNVDEDNKQLPPGVEDYSNENVDDFLNYLRKAGIEVLDIRRCMKEDEMDIYNYTYITDHHWTTEGAFYAFYKITEWIEAKTGVAVDPRVVDINEYNIIIYSNWHLGSYGARVGKYYAGVDDFDLIVPKFEVEFENKEGIKRTFSESVINSDEFQKRNVNINHVYDNGIITPRGVADTSTDFSVLFMTDSYGTVMAPYLKLAYSVYEKRHYPSGFSKNDLEMTNPDVVVFMPYYTSEFCDAECY